MRDLAIRIDSNQNKVIETNIKAPINSPNVEAHYCVNCGQKLQNDAKFCPNCGAKI